MYETLIEANELNQNVKAENWIIIDCRFSLADKEAGRRAYLGAHIPGAAYAHLDEDLCGPPTSDYGRHPLPAPEVMTVRFGQMGIGAASQVVVYDDNNGAIASRLWWMLHYMGHKAAAVLNGGWQAWLAAGFSARDGVEAYKPAHFLGSACEEMLVKLDEVESLPLLIDSRAPERYRGEIEPIDPVAGHIPGAVNFFYQRNWDGGQRYLSPNVLKGQFDALLGSVAANEATFHCGSGVTACANLLAMAHAGLGDGRLYVGSWSEWCTRK